MFLTVVLLKGNGTVPWACTALYMFRALCFDKHLEEWMLLKYWYWENYNFAGRLNYHFLEMRNVVVAFQLETGSPFLRIQTCVWYSGMWWLLQYRNEHTLAEVTFYNSALLKWNLQNLIPFICLVFSWSMNDTFSWVLVKWFNADEDI